MLSFDTRLTATLAQFDECVIVSTVGNVADNRYRLQHISFFPVPGFQKPSVSGTHSR